MDVDSARIEQVPFAREEIVVLCHSIEVAEDLISDFFKISTSEWKRYRYDIQSLKDLEPEEITDAAFAQIRRYLRGPRERMSGSEPGDYFKICLQDHVIRRAVARDPNIGLLPLSLYIVTHELIHVLRFAKFLQRFDTTFGEREAEEARVHELTYQLLRNRGIRGLTEVLGVFGACRTMETFVGIPRSGAAEMN